MSESFNSLENEVLVKKELKGMLLPTLLKIQEENGFISDTDMQEVADKFGVHPVEVYSLATFYHFFNIENGARHNIYIPTCISNKMAGIKKISEELEKLLKIKVGQVSKDRKFSLRYTSCIGMCDYAPSLLIDGYLIADVSSTKLKKIIKNIKEIKEFSFLKDYPKIKREGRIIFSPIESQEAIKKSLKLGRDFVLGQVRESGLRGRGGAGFPVGIKWNIVAATQAEKKFVICNADEGEPGTFKDRVLLVEYPELVLEGMVVAGFATGAQKGIVYLRSEYKSLLPILEGVLKKMRKSNILGKNILGKEGFNFDIEIRLGAGSYVCGEETALIESLEGNRGESRSKPPFPVNTGYFDYPTIINNVETFANIPHILTKGADFFKALGTEKSSGTKLVSVSGDCKKKGVYEIEFGMKIKDLLQEVGAKDPYAVCSGASGEIVNYRDFKRRICFEDFSTGGSIIVMDKKRSAYDTVKNSLKFLEEESCGQCTPCREGLPVLLEGLELLKEEKCDKKYLNDLLSLCETMQLASKCGLGQSAPKQFVNFVNNFPKEYKLSKEERKERGFNV